MKTITTVWIRAAFLAGIGLAASIPWGCGERVETREEEKTFLPKAKQVKVSPVQALPPMGSIEYVGTLSARRKGNVASETGGTIEKLYFEKGNRVKKGRLLAEINTSKALLDVQQAQAVLDAARSHLEKMETGTRPEEILIAEAAVKEAEADLLEAEKNFKRIDGLHRLHAVSNSMLDSAKRRFEMAQARVELAMHQLALAREGPRKEDKKAARANLEQANATLALSKDRLKKSRLHAPWDGQIAFRDVEIGEVIPPGTTITQVVDLDQMKIKISMSENDIRVLKKDLQYHFTVDALGVEEFSCRLFFLSPTADPVMRSFPVELTVDALDPRMADGMTARVRFPLANENKTIKVSSAWLSEENGKIGLFVVKDAKAVFVPVTLGAYYDQRVEILTGLNDQELVITNPAGLKTGDPVTY